MLVDEKLHRLVKQAVESGQRNPWLYGDHTDLYIRNSRRMIDGELYPSFEIANIQVHPNMKSKGVFKSFLNFVELEYRHRLIFVENILEPRLIEHFTKRGYSKYGSDELPCFYRLPHKEL